MERHFENDENLIAALQNTSSKAVFNGAVAWLAKNEGYYKVVEYLARSHQRSSVDPEDIFQDSLMILIKKIRNDEFNRDSAVKTFFSGICKNLFLKRMNSKVHYVEESQFYSLQDDSLNREERQIEKERRQRIQQLYKQLINTLKPKCQQLLNMKTLNYSMAAIAEEMGFERESSARNAVHRCREKLRESALGIPRIHQQLSELL